MPELPEVETTVKSLNILKNKKVINVDIHVKKLRYLVPHLDLKNIINYKITNLRRIAKYVIIDFARVRLPTDRDAFRETHLGTYLLIQQFHLGMIAIEQFEEGSLRTGSSLDTPQWQIINFVRDAFVIEEEVLHPQRAAFAHGGKLRRLIMRKSERRHVLVLCCKVL